MALQDLKCCWKAPSREETFQALHLSSVSYIRLHTGHCRRTSDLPVKQGVGNGQGNGLFNMDLAAAGEQMRPLGAWQ